MSEPAANLTLLEASVSVDSAVRDLTHLGTAVDKMGNAFVNAGNAAAQGAAQTDAAASKAAIAAGRSAAAAEVRTKGRRRVRGTRQHGSLALLLVRGV